MDRLRFHWEVAWTASVAPSFATNIKQAIGRIASDAENSNAVRAYRKTMWVVCSREDVGLPSADGVVVRILVEERELARIGIANGLNAEEVTYNMADGFQSHLFDNHIQWPLISDSILFASFLPERMALWKRSGMTIAEIGSLKSS